MSKIKIKNGAGSEGVLDSPSSEHYGGQRAENRGGVSIRKMMLANSNLALATEKSRKYRNAGEDVICKQLTWNEMGEWKYGKRERLAGKFAQTVAHGERGVKAVEDTLHGFFS